jgi:hypothetical protein
MQGAIAGPESAVAVVFGIRPPSKMLVEALHEPAEITSRGQELVLDRPTSVEFVGNTAYVLSVTGDVYRVEGL